MKHKKSAGLIAGILLVSLLSGCGTIKAMFNGSHEIYVQGTNAWDYKEDGSLALLRMAETMEIDPEYEAPKDFLIKNYDKAIAAVEDQLTSLSGESFDDLNRKSEIYNNLNGFYKYVRLGIVPNPLIINDRTLQIKDNDYSTIITETAELVLKAGMTEGKEQISSGNFGEADRIFDILLSDFLTGEAEVTKRAEMASAYAEEARRLADGGSMDDVELGFKAIRSGADYSKNIPELATAETELQSRKGELLLSDAKTLITVGDIDSLIKAYKIYQQVIKIFPDNEEYKKDAEGLKTEIAAGQYTEASQLRRNFDGKRDSYDRIIALYDAADSWDPDYNNLRSEREEFAKSAIIEIFVAVRHSNEDASLQKLLTNKLAAELPGDLMYEVVKLNSPEGKDLTSQVAMGSIPMEAAAAYGFEYIVMADNFRTGTPELRITREETTETSSYVSNNGRISKMSDSDKTALKFTAALTGDNGTHLTYNTVSSQLRAGFDEDGIDEIWFDVKSTIITEKAWYEGRLDYNLSFYDLKTRRNWSQVKKIDLQTASDTGRVGFSPDTTDSRLRQYLLNKYQTKSVEAPSVSNWDSVASSKLKSSFKGTELSQFIITNIR